MGGGGEYDGECQFDDNHVNDEYDDDNEYDGVEDGKGSRGGADDGGESNYDGHDVIRGPSFGGMGAWGIGHQSLAPTPPLPSSTKLTTTIAAVVGGRHAPPLRSIPSRQTPLVIVDVPDHGQRWWHKGVWGVVIRVVDGRRLALLYSFVRFRTTPEWTMGVRGAA